MAYDLELSGDDRRAIDWIGDRYAHGHELFCVLSDYVPEGDEWESDDTIVFHLPEHAAWQIMEISQECNDRWDCFDYLLREKMQNFVSEIV